MNENIRIKADYKKRLTMEAMKLSVKVEERVTVTKLIYRLIDDHLDEVLKKIEKEY